MSQFEEGLARCPANHRPLTPLSFLERCAWIYRTKPAVIHGERRMLYPELYARCRRLASALSSCGVRPGDTVSVLAPNTPPMLEAHFGVPMAGAVLNTINVRLDARTIAHILDHSEAKVFITDLEFSAAASEALALASVKPLVIDIDDPIGGVPGERLGTTEYEAFLQQGDPEFPMTEPRDEWQPIALNYTSGTTGNPKGVVYHHRGAYLSGLCNPMMMEMTPETVYLWTLPMFHCNGWCFTWGVTAVGGTHVCLRRFEPAAVFDLIRRHRVTHLCGAPIILNSLANAPEASSVRFDHPVRLATGGAAPPSRVIAAMEPMNFRVIHLYGLTETFGPATVCAWQTEWDGLDLEGRAQKSARQGVHSPSLTDVRVANPDTLEPVPADGETIGEILLRGHTIMRGYLKNPGASEEALGKGWFRTGDLGVLHPDGYVEIKDRSKDIIISGGENISSVELEEVLYKHPCVLEAAVVARPDEKWGETPCAFVCLKQGKSASAEEIIRFCRDNLAHYKIPRTIVFEELPKTATGKVQKHLLRDKARTF
ncbi:MAG: acyl-CoA synthetase [bacterium]